MKDDAVIKDNEAVYLLNEQTYLHLRENLAGVGYEVFDKNSPLPVEEGQIPREALGNSQRRIETARAYYLAEHQDEPVGRIQNVAVTTLEKSYQFDPGYGVSAEDQAHIIGVMGTLWGEAIRDINRATYMAYPRAFALAEAGWTQMKFRNWESFKQRLYPNLTNLMKKGVSVRVPFEIVERK